MMTTILLAATLAQAFPVSPENLRVEFHLLPPGHELVLEDGKKVRYYFLHEWLELAAADSKLRELELKTKLIADLEVKVVAQASMIKSQASMLSACDTQSARRLKKYEQCEKDLVEVQSGLIWPYLVGATGAAIGIFGTALYLKK